MSWYRKIIDDLFKREVPNTEVEAIFSRLDVDEFFSYLNNLWEPGELIKKMGGYENLHKLYKDSEIYSAIDKRMAALLDTRLVIEGPDESLVKFYEDQILKHEDQLKKDFWWTVYNGWGVEQIIYDEKKDCTVVGFQREDFWRFEPQPDLIHVKLINTTDYQKINKVMPYGKWVLTTNDGSYNNPFGVPMAERLIQPWIFRCSGWDLWMDFAKRFANGFMHARIEDEAKKAEVREALEKAGKSSVFVTDKNTDLNLVQASRDSSLYSLIDDKTVASIQRVVLGETLTSAMQERGSSGASAIHNEVRLEKTRADISIVENAIDETIRQIGAVCKHDPKNLPKAKLIFDPGLNQELATRDATLVGAGVRFTKKYFINNYGFKEDEFEIRDVSANPFFSDKKKRTYLSPQDVKDYLGLSEDSHVCELDASDSRKDRRQLREKEELVDLLLRNGDEPINIDDLISAIFLSKDEDELNERLTSLFDLRDNSGFVELMTQGLFAAATKGALFGNPERISDEKE